MWLLGLPTAFQQETPAVPHVAVQGLAALSDLRVLTAFWLQHQASRAQGAPRARSALLRWLRTWVSLSCQLLCVNLTFRM